MIRKTKEKIASLCSDCGNRRCRGSILLEAAIAVSVIGLISGFFLTKGIIVSRAAQERKTRDNIEIVTSALAAYVSINKRLPRPSSPERKGIEMEEINAAAIGNVPFSTLGISERSATDGKGRRLIYAVEPELTDEFEAIYFNSEWLFPPKYFCDSSIIPKIKIKTNAPNKDIVAFVIDTEDNYPRISGESIIVTPSLHTFWVRRNFFLMHYLKGCPCDKENPE